MVANGCFLDEAFGEIKTQDIKNKRKKKKKETGPIVFDRSFNSMSEDIGGYMEDEELFSEIEKKEKKEEKKNHSKNRTP